MGTRADFYIGRGKKAEWLGSIAWDGYPDGLSDTSILTAKTEADFRAAVAEELSGREDGTVPAQGWPWPWDDSRTTDYAYAFDETRVYASSFGRQWFNPRKPEPEGDGPKFASFPNMRDRANLAPIGSKRSGTIVIVAK